MMCQFDRIGSEEKYPTIVFVQNKSKINEFVTQSEEGVNKIYKKLFKNSKLNVFKYENDNEEVNMIHFPAINNFHGM